MLNIHVIDTASEALQDLLEKSENLPMSEIAELLLESVRENFAQEGRPSPWAARVEPTGSWPLLNKSGSLLGGIESNVTGDQVEITHDTAYGDYLDQGTSRMVARPFMLVQDEDIDAIEEILFDHIFEEH
jgi:phage gpG-like protein